MALLQPAAQLRVGNERTHFGTESGRVERLLQVGDQGAHIARAVATFEDFRRALIELHHPFGVEQHVSVLSGLPLQTKELADRRTIGGWHGAAGAWQIVHCGEAFSIESSIVHRMSSLNCRISSARSCCSRRVKCSSVTSSPCCTSRCASEMRERKYARPEDSIHG